PASRFGMPPFYQVLTQRMPSTRESSEDDPGERHLGLRLQPESLKSGFDSCFRGRPGLFRLQQASEVVVLADVVGLRIEIGGQRQADRAGGEVLQKPPMHGRNVQPILGVVEMEHLPSPAWSVVWLAIDRM